METADIISYINKKQQKIQLILVELYHPLMAAIRNSGQLMWLPDKINDGTIAGNVSVKLMCDIVFPEDSRVIWKPFRNYSGVFDGCGFNISDIKYVSDKPIYNLENNIRNVEHGYYFTKTVWDDGTVTQTSGKKMLSGGGGTSISVDELLPGQSAVVELSITDIWKGPLQKRYEEAGLFFSGLKLGLGKMPLAKFCASLASSIVDGVTVVHVLDDFVVTTLEGSTTEIPYEIVTTGYTDEFIDEHTFDFVDAVVDAGVNSFVPDGVKQIYYQGKYYTGRFEFYYDLASNMTADAQKVADGTMTPEE